MIYILHIATYKSWALYLMAEQYAFTVCTPTYNRAHTLHRVYSSLAAQTYRDFEWLVIDDGSTDDTAAMIHQWTADADFPIRYIWQENQGKLTAVNNGVAVARGTLFLVFDSDDRCTANALERFKFHWDGIDPEIRSQFVGVTMLSVNQHGELACSRFPQDIFDSDTLEVFYRYHSFGEHWSFHRTEVLKLFPYSLIGNEKFVPEAVQLSAMARHYKTRFINEIHRIYWADASEDQLSNKSNPGKHALGQAFLHQSRLNLDTAWFWAAPLEFVRSSIHYVRFSLHARIPPGRQFSAIESWLGRCLLLIGFPAGFMIYWRDRIQCAKKTNNA